VSRAARVIAKIEELTGRKVAAFMSAGHIDPDSPQSSSCSSPMAIRPRAKAGDRRAAARERESPGRTGAFRAVGDGAVTVIVGG